MLLMLEIIVYSEGRFALEQFGSWIHLEHFSPRPSGTFHGGKATSIMAAQSGGLNLQH